MVFYKLRKDNLFHHDIGIYSAYGIDVFDTRFNIPVRSILDLSLQKDSLVKLIFLCNSLKLDIIHLDDVIQDFLA